MIENSLVSVIVIFLNAGDAFFKEAIASVFAQTYDHWELLLVDDGSTDDSTEIAKRYAQQYPGKVRYLEHENHQNLGMSASRNLGIYNSNGQYIALLDADDVWLPIKLEKQVKILDVNPEIAMVYGRNYFWYSWTGEAEDQLLDFVAPLGLPGNTRIQPPSLITYFLQDENIAPTPTGIMFRSDIAKAIGGFEASFRNFYEDMVFYCKIAFKSSVFVSDEHWHLYRQHSKNYSRECIKDGTWHPDKPNTVRFTLLNWVEQFLIAQSATDEQLWHTLQAQLFPYRHPMLYTSNKVARQFVEEVKAFVKFITKLLLPNPVRYWLRSQWRGTSQ
jgi:glycosyltransferase involved in cell wall biosynthesis